MARSEAGEVEACASEIDDSRPNPTVTAVPITSSLLDS